MVAGGWGWEQALLHSTGTPGQYRDLAGLSTEPDYPQGALESLAPMAKGVSHDDFSPGLGLAAFRAALAPSSQYSPLAPRPRGRRRRPAGPRPGLGAGEASQNFRTSRS
jgi:hypothetical protein